MRVIFNSRRISLAVPFITFLNIFVFILWKFSSETPDSFMAQNFLVSWEALQQGRYWTLVTSAFSHNMLFHIFINMYVFNGFGKAVEQIVGSRSLIRFYLFAGIISSLSHALTSAFLIGEPSLPALGASGSVAGIILLFALLFPKEKILLLGLIPLPAIMGAVLFVAIDLWGLSAQLGGHGLPIGHGAHLGGALAGFLYYVFILRNRKQKPDIKSSRRNQSEDFSKDVIDVDYEKLD